MTLLCRGLPSVRYPVLQRRDAAAESSLAGGRRGRGLASRTHPSSRYRGASPAVKPRAPENLTVHAGDHDTRLLTWSNPYPPGSTLHKELTYLVNISSENDPAEVSARGGVHGDPARELGAGEGTWDRTTIPGPRDPALPWASPSASWPLIPKGRRRVLLLLSAPRLSHLSPVAGDA